MAGGEWAFLLDENISRELEEELADRGYRVSHVVDELGAGAEDLDDVLPYAVKNELVIVTKDYSDFGTLDAGDHKGTVLITDHTNTARDMAAGIEEIVDAYPSRDAFRGEREYLETWIPD